MLLTKLHDQLRVGIVLALTMIITRGTHSTLPFHLLDASWAVFFLVGVYLSAGWIFLALCALAVVIDWIVMTWGGVSSFCFTPGYTMVLPAYASLWLGGRWYAQRHRNSLETLPMLGIGVTSSAVLAELFSSGGFYFLGGRFAEPSLQGFIERLFHYFPQSLSALLLYVCIAGVCHAALIYKQHGQQYRSAIMK